MDPSLNHHPSAWRGKELFASRFWEQELTLEQFLAPSDEWIGEVREELEEGRGAVLLKGSGLAVAANPLSAEFLQFCSAIGTPVSQSASGEKVFSVRNEGYASDDPRARGPNTRKKLTFHTDRCDVIAFLCLKPAKSGGENQVVSSLALYNEMLRSRPDLVEVLCQPFFYQRHNVDHGNELPYTRQPVFSFFEGVFASNFLRVLIERAYSGNGVPPMTDLQREALDTLEELAEDPELHVTFRQEEGDILLLNNWITYHRRFEFEDFPETRRRRHILRVWLSMPNSRAIDPLFAGNYGATGAGEIRGGMKART